MSDIKKQYARGTQKEYLCMRILRKQGYYCFRSAGSHGVADVIALNHKEVKFIQVKFTRDKNWQEKKYIKDIEALRNIPCPEGISKELWVKVFRENFQIVVIK